MIDKSTITAFTKGIHNLISDELIPNDAASDSLGWLTKDGKAELMYGRQAQGGSGAAGKIWEEHVGYRVNGTSVRFRKIWNGTSGIVQHLAGSTWTNTITGLTNEYATFSNYSSLAGNFVYINSPTDGPFKIVTANPGSFSDVYLSTKNFKGWSLIDKGRMLLWGRKQDPTGLYGSYIDGQDATVYTTVTAEVTAGTSGTLAFKAGGARRTCFGIALTVTAGGQVYSDNFDGTLTGTAGGTGTINYTTGAWTVTAGGAGTVNYQWEDSAALGVTDFSKSATRLAGQGFVVRQDQGGDAIRVVLPLEGSYFSMKATSVYNFTPEPLDLNPTNEIFRTDVGIKNITSAVATSVGIVYMNTANPTRPVMTILQRNDVGDNFTTTPLFPHFRFSDYNYDSLVLETWDKYVIASCRFDSSNNNRLLVADMVEKTVDVAPYGGSAFAKDGGFLYMGDPVSQTSYELFTGFDDMGITLPNYWISAGDRYGTDILKKTKRYRFKGAIAPDQSVSVYLSFDSDNYVLVGTILGSGEYVDYTSSYAIGTTVIGSGTLGGDDTIPVYRFIMELKVRQVKFRKRNLKFVANGIGYVALEEVTDFDIWQYQDKLPAKYRSKQNVSTAGTPTNQPTPTY